MSSLTIDSSVFLSSLLEYDTHHDASFAFFSALQSESFTITLPMIVILEIANILAKQNKNPDSALESLMGFTILSHDHHSLNESLAIFKRIHLKTSDALIVWCAYASESTLISWDKQLIREAQKLVDASTPTLFMKKMR